MARDVPRSSRRRRNLELEKWTHRFIGPLGDDVPSFFRKLALHTLAVPRLIGGSLGRISDGDIDVRIVPALVIALAAMASTIPASAQNAASRRDGSHDMDFSIGNWTTEVTIIKDPFNRPDEQVHMKGTKVARPVWNGKAVLEEIEADGAGNHWQGANLFLYDPKAGQWSQNYADSSDGRMDGTPSIGGYRDGNLEFYSQEFVGDRAMLVRGTWRILSADLHTYEIDRSIDGGRSWHRSFLARVSRRK
jgi:hypothetical protein